LKRFSANQLAVIIYVVSVVIAITIGGLVAILRNSQNDHNDDVHLHAGFKIFTDGQALDLSSDKHMHFSTCSPDIDESDLTVKDKVHLHNNIGDVAHIHAENVTWRNLFESLELDLLEDQPLPVMYRNDSNDPDLLDKTIQPYESAIFIFGTADDVDSLRAMAVTIDSIKEAESKTEGCSV
jgi:hypothetical protein